MIHKRVLLSSTYLREYSRWRQQFASAKRWTLVDLAVQAGTSRSVLDENALRISSASPRFNTLRT